MSENALERAIEFAGSQAALARAIGGRVRQQHIYYWLRHAVPAEYCADIERATHGRVTRRDLRPDIFDEPPRCRERRAGAPVEV